MLGNSVNPVLIQRNGWKPPELAAKKTAPAQEFDLDHAAPRQVV
jgi:hypothetical protein